MRSDFDVHWEELAAEVLSGMKEWRLQHPKATLRQIETTPADHPWRHMPSGRARFKSPGQHADAKP